MLRIGLTGGIGSGKSTVAAMFAQLGAKIIDADAISRELMRPGSAVLAQVAAVFGNHILTSDGYLERAELAKLVFSDEQAREKLNAIVHPAVRRRSAELLEQAQAEPDFSGVVIEDIPLLTETKQAGNFDGVIVVFADLQTRLQRLTCARGMTEEDALARIRAQASDEERASIASWIIDNSGSQEQTLAQVEQLWSRLTKLL